MKENIKSCPFCGGKLDMVPNARKTKYHPCCNNEKCIMFTGGNWYNTEKEATEAWNRRTIDEAKLANIVAEDLIQCPVCGEDLYDEQPSRCPECGQALYWEF